MHTVQGATDCADSSVVSAPTKAAAWPDLHTSLTELSARPETPAGVRELLMRVIDEHASLHGLAFAIATRYRSFFDALPDAVMVHDECGRVIDANGAACRLYAYERDSLMQLTIATLNPSLSVDHLQRVLATHVLGGSYTVETTNLRGDGRAFPVEVHSAVYSEGEQLRIVAITRDISARQVSNNELRESEQRFRLLLQAMDKGVIVQDRSGRIIACNPAACRILAWSESQLLAMRARQLVDWSFVDEAGKPSTIAELPASRAFQSGGSIASTVVGIHLPHAGTLRWLSITAVPQFAGSGRRPFRVVSTFDDITAIKREAEMFAQTQSLANIGGWQFIVGEDALLWTGQMYVIFDLPAGSRMTLERMCKFFPGDDRMRLQKAITAAHRGESVELDLRMTTSIDRRRWVRVLARPIRHGAQVHGVSGTLQDITERKQVEETLRRKLQTDPLTGLPNRDAMLEVISQVVESAAAGAGPSLLYVNLDRFRAVNDLLGYGAGDRLLKVAAQRLCASLPGDTVCARFSGDEFLVLVPPAQAKHDSIAQRVSEAFDQPFALDDHEFRMTISIGMACHPDDGATAQQLVTHAGAAMVEAKRRGRNNWQRFTPALARQVSNRNRIEALMRHALETGEFYLEFQPQVDLDSNRVRSAEALLRWHSHELGELQPDMFVPYAENNGDIIPIGAWAIREACRQLRAWRDAGIALERIAVNVSYRQVLSGSLASTVITALREFDLPGEALELELTERVLIEDLSDSQQTFSILQGLGVKMVLDDFGEGYSALGYLRRLPIAGLKISHGFLQSVPGSASDTAICEAIIHIGRSLGLVIIAEGVENEQQRKFLIAHGTRLAQGYLFSRSLKPDAFAAFVRSRNGGVSSAATR